MVKRVIKHPLYQDVVNENGKPIKRSPDELSDFKQAFSSAFKGGQGSGNFGHGGLSGTWGGSTPTKNAPKMPDMLGKLAFIPALKPFRNQAQAQNIKTVLGSKVKPVDDKYLVPNTPEQIDMAVYFVDNPDGALLFEVPNPTFDLWSGVGPKYLLLSKSVTGGQPHFNKPNLLEWDYRATILLEDGEPIGHFTPALSQSDLVWFDIYNFSDSFFEAFIYNDGLNIAPDTIQLVGELADESTKEINIALKGGEGSGNFGHGGLSGVWGGSTTDSSAGSASAFDASKYNGMSIQDRKKAFFAQPAHVVDAQARASQYIPQFIQSTLQEAGVGERPNTGSLRTDIVSRVKQYGDMTFEANKGSILDTGLELESILGLAGVEESLRREITMDALDNLVVQDYEAMSRQLGDHGIHHIQNNIKATYEIMKVVPGADTPQSMAEMYLTHIYHDTGYLTEPSQIFLDSAHPRWSRQHYNKNIKSVVTQALGKESAEHISFMIESHGDTGINWNRDALASAVRIADNMSVFHKEKLPQLFRSVPQNLQVLEMLQLGKITEAQANMRMVSQIKQMNFTPRIATQLIAAAKECNRATPMFTLGMMGGNFDSFDWADGHLKIYLRKNSEGTRLQKLLDLGQRQFAKFAKSYGVDWKYFRNHLGFKFPPDGETLLEAIMVGEKERKSILKSFRKVIGRWLE